MRRFSVVLLFMGLVLSNESDAKLTDFRRNIIPLLEEYCLDCHSNDKAEADINFDDFRTIKDIKKESKVWIKVDRMLSSRQMPPRESDQPSDDDRKLLSGWVQSFLMDEAKARAGDPGRVILRRLSNDEYNPLDIKVNFFFEILYYNLWHVNQVISKGLNERYGDVKRYDYLN